MVRRTCQDIFFKKAVAKNFAKIHRITLARETPAQFFFPMNFAKLLRTPFFVEYLRLTVSMWCDIMVHFRKS